MRALPFVLALCAVATSLPAFAGMSLATTPDAVMRQSCMHEVELGGRQQRGAVREAHTATAVVGSDSQVACTVLGSSRRNVQGLVQSLPAMWQFTLEVQGDALIRTSAMLETQLRP